MTVGRCLDHCGFGKGRQDGVPRRGDDVVQAGLDVEELKQLGPSKTPVEADTDARRGKRHRNTAAQRYCSASSSKVRKPATAESTTCRSGR